MVTASNELVGDLVIANRVLYAQGVVDAFGHVSVRHDADPERFLLARNMAPGSVSAEDILEFDLDGNALRDGERGVYLERFIHGEIYRSRPDVIAVVHSHSPAVIPFSVLPSVPLQPMWHMSGFIPQKTPVFEIRDYAGDASDLLIRTNSLGQNLATVLGAENLVLMRGHGATLVGESLAEAVFRAVYTQKNAELQLRLIDRSDVVYLTPGEAAATTASNRTQFARAWNLWKQEAAI
jgi:ribulose-5-phosphate 4-epimerase/fuculose-1-phosphate aldolase